MFIAVNVKCGIVTGVSDLVENSRLKSLIRVVVADLVVVVVALERRILALADMFAGLSGLLRKHLQDGFEDFSETIFRRLRQLLSVVDVVVDAVDARHAVFTRMR